MTESGRLPIGRQVGHPFGHVVRPPGAEPSTLGEGPSDLLDFVLADDEPGQDRPNVRRVILNAARMDGLRVVRLPLADREGEGGEPARLAAAVGDFYQTMLPRHMVRWRV